MRLLSLISTLCVVASAAATQAAITELWRAYNGQIRDHFYTTDFNEYNNALARLGYKGEGVAARIYNRPKAGTVPLYRMYSAGAGDHFYTISAPERDNAVQNLGYAYEGITGYVYAAATAAAEGSAVPFYRGYSAAATDHFYTVSAEEMDNAVRNLGYSFEGTAAYVFGP